MNHGEFNFANFAPFTTGAAAGLFSFITSMSSQLK
jgi:hypothetical protein